MPERLKEWRKFEGWWRDTRALLSNGDHRRYWPRLHTITVAEAQAWTRRLDDEIRRTRNHADMAE